MDYLFLFFGVALFIAVILLVEGIYVSWNSARGPEAKRIAQRLQTLAGDNPVVVEASIRKKRVFSESPGVQRLLQQIPRVQVLDRLLQQSGASYNVGRFLLVSLGCGATVLALGLLLAIGTFSALLLALAALGLPLLAVLAKRRKRLKFIEKQLPDALDLMCRALRAGHALPVTIRMVGEEMADPIAGEFRTVSDEVTFGMAMQDALANLAARVPGTDVGYFVVAVLIQRESGGNLTELLGNIAAIVRGRLKLFGEIRVLSAEGRLSAWILGVLPFALAALLNLVNPGFMQILWTDPAGHKMLVAMLVMMTVGIVWMRQIVRIRV